MAHLLAGFRFSIGHVYAAAALLRVGLFLYGLLQDAYSPMKYTDIDYFVFTDAAQFVSRGRSPYDRETYRYTPLLAWLLLPCTWYRWSFHFGKIIFAVGDIVAGWLIVRILQSTSGMSRERALRFASLWLLNPMVATISTRGSSEGLLDVIVVFLLWATLQRRIKLAGFLLGLAVHFKIFPFIYGVSIIWWLDGTRLARIVPSQSRQDPSWLEKTIAFVNPARVTFASASVATFALLSAAMYFLYGWPYLEHSYFYHLIRLDHRHNFSVYNTLLHLKSSPSGGSSLNFESLAFVPQLLLSAVLIPLALAKTDLASAMLAQTFAFVTFNKVCTSQYFLWYMVFLPLYLPKSSFLSRPGLGMAATALWVAAQAMWLQQGYQLEFLGRSTFVPGLWLAGVFFFVINIYILGVIISDVGNSKRIATSEFPRQKCL